MSKNRIKLNICGSECVISSDDSESYVRSIGDEVEKAMEDITSKNERVSITMAAIITALRYCDEAHKAPAEQTICAPRSKITLRILPMPEWKRKKPDAKLTA